MLNLKYFKYFMIAFIFGTLIVWNLQAAAPITAETQPVTTTSLSIDWAKTYGQKADDYAICIVPVGNDSFVLGGGTKTSVSHLDNFWVKKIDRNGDTIWTKSKNSSILDYVKAIIQTPDGGFVLSGFNKPYGQDGPDNAAFVKLDKDGNIVWNVTTLKQVDEAPNAIIKNSQGQFFYIGHLFLKNSSHFIAYMGLIDQNGDTLWRKSFVNNYTTDAQSVIEVKDGGYVITGYKDVSGNGNFDAWVAKVDKGGNLLWEKTYGGVMEDSGHKVIETPDNHYIILGETDSQGSGGSDVWIFEIDSAGKVIWEKTYGGKEDDKGFSLIRTYDGGYLIGATTKSYGSGSLDAWLIKIDSDGNYQWSTTIGGPKEDALNSVIETNPNEYIMVGMTNSYGSGGYDAWVVKLG